MTVMVEDPNWWACIFAFVSFMLLGLLGFYVIIGFYDRLNRNEPKKPEGKA